MAAESTQVLDAAQRPQSSILDDVLRGSIFGAAIQIENASVAIRSGLFTFKSCIFCCMETQQTKSILTVALLAAFADGLKDERERESVRKLAEAFNMILYVASYYDPARGLASLMPDTTATTATSTTTSSTSADPFAAL